MKTSISYNKDNGKYSNPINYSEVFGLPLSNTSLALINSRCYAFKDAKGVYTYVATYFDNLGNVTFTKTYQNN